MRPLLHTFAFLLCLGLGLSPLYAQPVAAVNVASFANPNLPNGGIAQGSMFTIFGSNMGPAALAQATSFPLPAELGGTSVQVTVSGQQVDCIMIFSLSSRVAAILPSSTPLGQGTLTVTFNGSVSAPIPITVVAHSFGTFAINQGGSGPSVITDPSFVPNTLLWSAHAGETWSIWGTGVGAVAGDEAAGPLPGDLPYNVQVLVGGIPAQVVYRGRSGCCAGVDQIAFLVPAGVTGCYVPITVVVEGVSSNFTTMSITESGSACSDPASGLSSDVLTQAGADGDLRLGTIGLSRQRVSFSVPQGVGQTFEINTDSAFASYDKFDTTNLLSYQGVTQVSTIGACLVFQISGSAQVEDPITGTPLDPGNTLTLTGPSGSDTITATSTGEFFKLFGTSGIPGLLRSLAKGEFPLPKDQFPPPSTGFLDEGRWVASLPGGADVQAHTAAIDMPPRHVWTNQDQINVVDRSRPLTITYSGGSPDGIVQIAGFAPFEVLGETITGAMFFCAADPAAGQFTVGTPVLSALPDSPLIEGNATGGLMVGSVVYDTFDAGGLEFGSISATDISFKILDYE